MILLDSSYLIGLADARDRWHTEALRLRDRLRGTMVISNLAMAEAITVVGHRKGGKAARTAFEYIVDNCDVVFLNSASTPDVLGEFLRYDGTISLADAHSIWLMRAQGVGKILSFDEDFDKVTGIERFH